MLAERKLEILKALVEVSGEITSTLRLDRLLGIIVNSPQNVLPYERCAIALDQRGKLQLKAVSGMAALPLGDITVERLNQLMRWLSIANRVGASAPAGKSRRGKAERDSGSGCGVFCRDRFSCALCPAADATIRAAWVC